MKVPFAMPECDPQITCLRAVTCLPRNGAGMAHRQTPITQIQLTSQI